MLNLVKGHGSRNDILIVDGAPDADLAASELPAVVRALCDRNGPLGSDGVYFVDDVRDEPEAWFFNPDGSPSLLCGNGMRIVGRELMDRRDADSVVVRTGEHRFDVRRAATSPEGVIRTAVNLPHVSFHTDIVASDGDLVGATLAAYHPDLPVTAVSVPNDHLVSVVKSFDEADLIATGQAVANNATVFPRGANVSYLMPLDGTEVFVATFERGAGLTASCGSGLAASRAVYSKVGAMDPDVPLTIRNPGGPSVVSLRSQNQQWFPTLEGNASLVYRTQLAVSDLLRGGQMLLDMETYVEEITAFSQMYEEHTKALHDLGVHYSAL